MALTQLNDRLTSLQQGLRGHIKSDTSATDNDYILVGVANHPSNYYFYRAITTPRPDLIDLSESTEIDNDQLMLTSQVLPPRAEWWHAELTLDGYKVERVDESDVLRAAKEE